MQKTGTPEPANLAIEWCQESASRLVCYENGAGYGIIIRSDNKTKPYMACTSLGQVACRTEDEAREAILGAVPKIKAATQRALEKSRAAAVALAKAKGIEL